jgi:hypothetical protein
MHESSWFLGSDLKCTLQSAFVKLQPACFDVLVAVFANLRDCCTRESSRILGSNFIFKFKLGGRIVGLDDKLHFLCNWTTRPPGCYQHGCPPEVV